MFITNDYLVCYKDGIFLHKWIDAMKIELEAIEKNETWQLV